MMLIKTVLTLLFLSGFAIAEPADVLKRAGKFTLEKEGTTVTGVRLSDPQVTYSGEGRDSWIFLTVKNPDRQRSRDFYATISHVGSVTIFPPNESVDTLAKKKLVLHGHKYEYAKIEEAEGEAKLLICESRNGRKLLERRVFLWWKHEESILCLDFTYSDFRASTKCKQGRKFLVDTLTSLQIDGEPTPLITGYLEILGNKNLSKGAVWEQRLIP